MIRFQEKLQSLNLQLKKSKINVLQVNLGKFCNLTCVHCHVESGPSKTEENMNEETAQAVVRFMKKTNVEVLDLTGGAPELNPHFRYLANEGRSLGIHVIDRCNLTVIYEEGQETLPEYLAQNQIEVIASLPCYEKENVDKQRGRGTFDQSVEAILRFNELGYGREGSGLLLNLVYNPVGPQLPPNQYELENAYKDKLYEEFGIIFNRLYTITNMPITRYERYLKALGQYDSYVELLGKNFNPSTLKGLMCTNTLNVGWDGKFYDCDFNHAIDMPMTNGRLLTVFNSNLEDIENRLVRVGDHCFGCTAGSGSSCQGAVD